MRMSESDSNFCFLIITDFSKDDIEIIQYVLNKAKRIQGSVELLCLIDSSGIENQKNLSSLSDIQKEHKDRAIKMKSTIEMIDSEGVFVQGSYLMGDVKNELKRKIILSNADVVVVGDANDSWHNQIKEYLVNDFDGDVIVAKNINSINEGNGVFVVCEESSLENFNSKFISKYCSSYKFPLNTIQIFQNDEAEIKSCKPFRSLGGLKVSSDYKARSKSMNEDLLSLVNINSAQLLCVSRKNTKKTVFNRLVRKNRISDLEKNINVPLFIMSKK